MAANMKNKTTEELIEIAEDFMEGNTSDKAEIAHEKAVKELKRRALNDEEAAEYLSDLLN